MLEPPRAARGGRSHLPRVRKNSRARPVGAQGAAGGGRRQAPRSNQAALALPSRQHRGGFITGRRACTAQPAPAQLAAPGAQQQQHSTTTALQRHRSTSHPLEAREHNTQATGLTGPPACSWKGPPAASPAPPRAGPRPSRARQTAPRRARPPGRATVAAPRAPRTPQTSTALCLQGSGQEGAPGVGLAAACCHQGRRSAAAAQAGQGVPKKRLAGEKFP